MRSSLVRRECASPLPDPNVPPLPPHITLEQARNYLKAILKGDPDALRIIKSSVKEMLA
jgi:pyruvate dehydrogenase (quinone)